MPLTIAHTYTADVLVLGAGLSGLRAAHTAAQNGAHVLLCAKTHACGGASFYPQMDTLGCQCPTADARDADWFLQEIADSSLSMHDEWMSRYYIQNIRQRLMEAPEIGVHPQPLGEEKRACFAQRPRDIFYWGGWDDIRAEARARIKEQPNIQLLEGADALCLLTGQKGEAQGAVLLLPGGTLAIASAPAVVLATGGYGGLYLHNLNTPDVAGSGQALALAAGAQLVNLEFQQFIPGFLSPLYKTILREGTLDHVTALTGPDGEDMLRSRLPNDDEYFACLHRRATHGPFTSAGISKHFDIALMDAAVQSADTKGVRLHYAPTLLEDTRKPIRMHLAWLKAQFGVDNILDEAIYIAPFFHAANGGVLVGRACETTVPGLFAAGEAAGGIHGADRHGGNATGACFVFGHLAGKSAAAWAKGAGAAGTPGHAAALEQLHSLYPIGKKTMPPREVAKQVRTAMWLHANVARSEAGLQKTLDELRGLQAGFAPGTYLGGPDTAAATNAAQLLALGQAVLHSMLARRESRGSHYREDYPTQNNKQYLRRGVVTLQNGALRHSFMPTAQ